MPYGKSSDEIVLLFSLFVDALMPFTCDYCKMRNKTIIFFFLYSPICFTQTWEKAGGGTDGNIEAMDIFQNKLYISGGFQTAGNIPAYTIAQWNGIKWDSLSGKLAVGGAVLLTHSDTMLYVWGGFFDAGGVPNTFNLAKWNGSQWFSVSSAYPQTGSSVHTIITYKDDFYIGGNFSQIGSTSVNRIGRWNGASWDNVAGGVTGGFIPKVQCMAVYNGDLYVGGDFTFAGGKPANYIARWNGISWDTLGSGLNEIAARMFVDTINNSLYTSGGMTYAGGVAITNGLAKWDGVNWHDVPIAYTLSGVNSFAMYRGKLFLGYYSATASVSDTILASWDGTTWKRIEGPNDGITSLAVYNDTLFVGGFFDKVYDSTKGLLTVNYIAKYWEPLSGINEPGQSIKFKVYPNPAKNNITIEAEENQNFIVSIVNPLGQKVLEKNFQKKTEIDISAFGKGLFLVEVLNEKGVKCYTKKVVME